jgi:hypothetical protein
MSFFRAKMTKLSARLFVEFERRGLREYSTVHVHVQEWMDDPPRDADGSHRQDSVMAGSASHQLWSNCFWSYVVWYSTVTPCARKTPEGSSFPLTPHLFWRQRRPSLPSRLPYPRPSDCISSLACLGPWTYAPSFPLLFSLSPPPDVPAFVSPFHCIHHSQDLCMFRPVTIGNRDAIRSQSNGTLNFQSQGMEFLGPKALSMFISAIETGVIIVLFSRFFVRKRERLVIQFLVYFVTFMALCVAFEYVRHRKSIF